jgi:hypothetical protein
MRALTDPAVPGGEAPRPFHGALPLAQIARPALLDLFAVRVVVAPERAEVPSWFQRLVAVSGMRRHVVYLNPMALPRAYTSTTGRGVPDAAAALAAVVAPGFDPHAETVVVGELAVTPAPDTPWRPAAIVRDDAERVEVAVDVSRPAVLVLADALAPGWRVTVDGVPRPLLQANYWVRGVAVAPGDRRVVFTYRAPGFRAGVVIAAVAWVALLAVRRRWIGAGVGGAR